MATVTNIPIGEGSVSVIHDDTPDTPWALQISIDLAALSLRMTDAQAKFIALILMSEESELEGWEPGRI